MRPIYRTGVPLLSRCCILYIFSTNICTGYFKHAAHSPFFSSKCRLFHNATFFGSRIIHILLQDVLKFKCKTLVPKFKALHFIFTSLQMQAVFLRKSAPTYQKTRHGITQHAIKFLCWFHIKLNGSVIISLNCYCTTRPLGPLGRPAGRPHTDMSIRVYKA